MFSLKYLRDSLIMDFSFSTIGIHKSKLYLNCQSFSKNLMFSRTVYSNLKKVSKNNNKENNNNDFEYIIDIFKMTNESLTIALNSIIKIAVQETGYIQVISFNFHNIQIN